MTDRKPIITKVKITKPEQLIINGEPVERLGQKARLADKGQSMNEVIDRHLRQKSVK